MFKRVLVYDIINNPASITKYITPKKSDSAEDEDDGLTEEEREINKELDFDVQHLARAPIGSILGFEVGGGDKINLEKDEDSGFLGFFQEEKTKLKLYFPFFSSHFSLPVKPGEHVAVIGLPGMENNEYWISRIHSELDVEDLNYTHHDRRNITLGLGDESKEKNEKFRKPGFPNGTQAKSSDPDFTPEEEEKEDFEEQFIISQRDGYEKILENSKRNNVVFEPVPRFKKRPGDTVIQGSNNSLIVLGTNRGYGISSRPEKNKSNYDVEESPVEAIQGSIDLVVGRGRLFGEIKEGEGSDQNALTRSRVIKNTREDFELDKDATSDESNTSDIVEKCKHENRYMDVPEGDPDFINDAARVYITMSGDIDDQLGIIHSAIPDTIDGSSSEQVLSSKPDLSSVSAKADRIRIVARNTGTSALSDLEYKDVEVSDGDIRIIKQGETGLDSSSIYMLPDGAIQISGKVILMGRSEDTMVEGIGYGGAGPGDGGLNPFVRFSDLKKVLTELFAALDEFTTTMQTHVTPGFGSPSPQITQASTKLQADLLKIDSESMNFDALASKRIFGE